MEIWLGVALVCGVVGSIIGSSKNASGAGFILGIMFGPLGVLAAFAIDSRTQCPKCGGRLNGKPLLCQHCNSHLTWPAAAQHRASWDFSVRCSECKSDLDIEVTDAGNSILCPRCNRRAVSQLFRS